MSKTTTEDADDYVEHADAEDADDDADDFAHHLRPGLDRRGRRAEGGHSEAD